MNYSIRKSRRLGVFSATVVPSPSVSFILARPPSGAVVARLESSRDFVLGEAPLPCHHRSVSAINGGLVGYRAFSLGAMWVSPDQQSALLDRASLDQSVFDVDHVMGIVHKGIGGYSVLDVLPSYLGHLEALCTLVFFECESSTELAGETSYRGLVRRLIECSRR